MSVKYFEFEELLSPPIKRAAYSDRTAWLMAKISNLTYFPFEKDDTALKSALIEAEFELVKTFCSMGTQAFLAKRNSDKMAVLSFRGTQTQGMILERILDAIADLYVTMHTNEKGEKVHNGFQLAFSMVEQEILQEVRKLDAYGLYITGHSLGGALALIATRAISSDEVCSDNLSACYTFGSPKVGNEEFDDNIKCPIYRIVNSYDLVPFLPFTPLMQLVFLMIPKKYKKQKIKTLIDNFKEYRNCGAIRFLTHVKSNCDAKALEESDELGRSLTLLWRTLTVAKDISIQHHSIDIYCEKLGYWALKRQERE